MEWFKIISQFIANLLWPATVLILVILFRKEIRSLFSAIKELKYPGGSVTLEVAKLEESVEKTKSKMDETVKHQLLFDSSQFKPTDPQLAIAQLRIDIEKELFRLSWITQDIDNIKGWSVDLHIYELENSHILEPNLAENLRMFVKISNSIVHGAEIPDEVKYRSNSIGAALVAQLHYKRKVSEMEKDFDGHGLWHMRKHISSESMKYYFYSAVVASLREFDYNYDIYKEAANRYNKKVEIREEPEHRKYHILYILSLDEFIKVLEFREKELLRLINVYHNPHGDTWKEFEKANYWQWPPEWGDLGWKAPIIRDRLSLYEAENDLMQTRTALNNYRARLVENR